MTSLAAWADDARKRTLSLVADLSDEELMGPRLDIVNPLRWELGHVAWFQEKWVLRTFLKRPPILPDGDALYDSSAVAHDTRWDLPLPSRERTLDYAARVLENVRDAIARHEGDPSLRYFTQLAIFHEDMHAEAFLMTRQTLGYPAPAWLPARPPIALRGVAEIAGGTFPLGSREGEESFVFDNEKWAHPVTLAPFHIEESPVTQAEFDTFVGEGGYGVDALWSEAGRRWRDAVGAEEPVYWRQRNGNGERRHFATWVPREPDLPVMNVSYHEAEAFARWAASRLPTEAEWELAALTRPEMMFQGVWEWTASDFAPYPGFSPDPYQDYSLPWFHTHKTLRGASWITQPRLRRPKFRNFYQPHRRDVFAGFRLCREAR